MEAKEAKPDFYIYALVSTNEKVKGQNSLRVDVGTFEGLGSSIEYVGISRNMPQIWMIFKILFIFWII